MSKYSGATGAILPFLMALAGTLEPRKVRDELEGLDILAEYEKIKRKESGLSSRLRARIVYIVEFAENHPLNKERSEVDE